MQAEQRRSTSPQRMYLRKRVVNESALQQYRNSKKKPINTTLNSARYYLNLDKSQDNPQEAF